MELSYAQKQAVYEYGYVHVRGVVPRLMVNAALRAINSSLGQGIDPAQLPRFRSQSYCPELQSQPVITELLTNTPAWSLAELLIGAGKIKPVRGGQIALRFPTMQDPPSPPHAHLDGMYSPNNGVPQGELRTFTMLVGIVLSDVVEPYAGNLAIWPGTHRRYERYFREHGPDSLLAGMPDVELPPAEQLIAQAGDIVLCHYQLAHGITANMSPNPRYAIYFRLTHVDHDANWRACMTDIWQEWAGMQDFVQQEEPIAAR